MAVKDAIDAPAAPFPIDRGKMRLRGAKGVVFGWVMGGLGAAFLSSPFLMGKKERKRAPLFADP